MGQRCLQHLQTPAYSDQRYMLLSFTYGHVSDASLVTEREAAGEAETSWDLQASEPGWQSAGKLLSGPGRVAPPAWRAQGAPGRGLGVEEPSVVWVHLVGLLIHNRAELPGASAPLPSIKIIGTSLQRFISREGSRWASFFLCLASSLHPHFQAHLSAFQPLQPRCPFHRPILFPLSPSENPRFLKRTLIYH